jgi:PAS domain S-box-containing protein
MALDHPTGGASEAQLRLLIESVRDYAIFMLDPTGQVVTWNLGAERLKGWSAGEIIGRHFSTFYTAEDREAGRPERELRIATAEGSYREEGIRVRKDGSTFLANVVLTAMRDESGTLLGFAKVTRDVSESHAAEERFRLLVESVQDYAIFMLDPDGVIESWNIGAQRLKGYASDEIIGRHFSIFYTENDRKDQHPQRELVIARAEGKYEEEGIRVRKDGSTFWANVLITALRDTDGTLRGFAKVTRDVSDRKAAELKLRAAFEELEQASRVKDEFLTTVSHELRTPMTSIVGWAALLTTGADPQTLQQGMRAILESAQLQAKLIDDLIDVAWSLTGKLTVDLRAVDCAEVVLRTIEAARPVAASKRLQLDLNLPPGPAVVAADRARLQQVVWNLLSNALKFTPAGGAIRIALTTDTQAAELRVTDTGRGMDEETLRNIFRRFWQGESTTTRSAGGMGIGLALARHLVELHGGAIAAESAGPGQGSTFLVTLPLAAEDVRSSEPSPSNMSLDGAVVLLLEDDPGSRLVLTKMVEQYGAEVIPVSTVEEGLRALEHKTPTMILSDLAMPEEDGFAFIHKLREHARAAMIPAIAITAVYLRAEDREKILAAGFDAYLRKPVLPAELTATLLRARHEPG